MTHPNPLVRQSAEWIEQIHGDEEAFERLFRAFAPGLIAFLTRSVRSRSVAEELVQDLFLTLWQKRGELEIREAVTSYLFTAARNRAINYLRRERRAAGWEDGVVGRIEDTTIPEEDTLLELLDLHDAVARLPARCRLIFTLSRQQDLTYGEIAQSLGLSIKTVEVQMGRALKSLRAWLRRSED
jgi:RNA polymerase sigma-70 factor (ECF subfamily)